MRQALAAGAPGAARPARRAELGLDELGVAARKDAALNRVHLLLDPVDAMLERRRALRQRRHRQHRPAAPGSDSSYTHNRTPDHSGASVGQAGAARQQAARRMIAKAGEKAKTSIAAALAPPGPGACARDWRSSASRLRFDTSARAGRARRDRGRRRSRAAFRAGRSASSDAGRPAARRSAGRVEISPEQCRRRPRR